MSVGMGNRRAQSPQHAPTGPSHEQQPSRMPRTMQRTDGNPPPSHIYAASTGGRSLRSKASNSRSASPNKPKDSRHFPTVEPQEEEEEIENPNGRFEGDSDIEYLDQTKASSSKTTNPPAAYTPVGEGTRTGVGRRPIGSNSPTRPTAEYVDTTGDAKASANAVFAIPVSAKKTPATRQSTGSASPTKRDTFAGHPGAKGKGKVTEHAYVELDDRPASESDEDDYRHLPSKSVTKGVIPPSGVLGAILHCDTKVTLSSDMSGQARKMWVRRVELHPDGLSLGDPVNWKNANVFINKSNITEFEVRSHVLNRLSISTDVQYCDQSDCPLIFMTVVVERDTKVDIRKLHALIAPGIANDRPDFEQLARVELRIPLKLDQDAKGFVREYRKRFSSNATQRLKLT